MKRALTAALVVLLVAAATAIVTGSAASISVSSRSLTQFTRPGPTTQPVIVVLAATADTSVGPQTTTGSGTSVVLTTNPHTSGNASAPTENYRETYVRFDLSSLPAGATIQSASLTLHRTSTGNRAYGAQRAAVNWSETLVWSGRPSVAGSLTTGTETASSVSWAVVDDVKHFIATPSENFGWRVSDTGSGNSTSTFGARETSTASERPALEITYVP